MHLDVCVTFLFSHIKNRLSDYQEKDFVCLLLCVLNLVCLIILGWKPGHPKLHSTEI